MYRRRLPSVPVAEVEQAVIEIGFDAGPAWAIVGETAKVEIAYCPWCGFALAKLHPWSHRPR